MTHDTDGDRSQNGTVRDGTRREVHTFASAEEVARAGADRFVEIVRAALKENGRCSVVLAGGTTYMKMYALLAEREDIDWNRIHLFIGDERFVPYNDPQSNLGTICAVLIDRIPIPHENLHPIRTSGVSTEESAREYEEEILRYFRIDDQEASNSSEPDTLSLLSPEGRGAGGEGRLLEHAKRMRRTPTDAENKLWHMVRDRRVSGCKFKRQHPIGRFIVDFVCLEKRLVVGVDGSQHAQEADQQYDLERSAFLQSLGYRILRFWNTDVLENAEGVWDVVARALEENPSPSPLPSGERSIQAFEQTAFDLVLLGIGPDGHTLSIFPESRETREPSDHLTIAVHDSPKPPPQRVSLSYRAVNQAKNVLFLVTGGEKKEALEGILNGPQDQIKWPAQGVKLVHAKTEWLTT